MEAIHPGVGAIDNITQTAKKPNIPPIIWLHIIVAVGIVWVPLRVASEWKLSDFPLEKINNFRKYLIIYASFMVINHILFWGIFFNLPPIYIFPKFKNKIPKIIFK